MFINHKYIEEILSAAANSTLTEQSAALEKAESGEALTPAEIALLLEIRDENLLSRMFRLAGSIKEKIYGKRIVMFAPVYVSNYCVNNCKYCGYQHCNSDISRRRLTREELQEEVRILEKMGHKRLALEAGEDPKNCPIEYILESLDAIYETKLENGQIRRVNVNIAATTIEDYVKLRDKGIGTYILFQETYHKPTYESLHKGPKANYEYHLTAFDRAMEAGIDDVGGGALFGLYDPKFEIMGLLLHNLHLEEKYGVGFHTISMPRLKPAEGIRLSEYLSLVDDELFKKLVAVIRIAVPYTGIIMSTRETAEMRRELLKYGVSQVSAGSSTGVGGYKSGEESGNTKQFSVSDERTPLEVINSLLDDGYIPSYCTACYRQGRTGDRFMQLARTGEIQNVCTPNALLTFYEYILDYGDDELLKKGEALLREQGEGIKNEEVKKSLFAKKQEMEQGLRDLFF